MNLSCSDENTAKIAQTDGCVAKLIRIFREPCVQVNSNLLFTLMKLSDLDSCKVEIGRSEGCIMKLIMSLKDWEPGRRIYAAAILANLSTVDEFMLEIVRPGICVPELFNLLEDPFKGVREQSAWALMCLSASDECRVQIKQVDGYDIKLFALLATGTPIVRKKAGELIIKLRDPSCINQYDTDMPIEVTLKIISDPSEDRDLKVIAIYILNILLEMNADTSVVKRIENLAKLEENPEIKGFLEELIEVRTPTSCSIL
jgi:hypothetical protein